MSHGHSPNIAQMIIRQSVRLVPCPTCGAVSGQKCIGKRVKVRAASHAARWEAYRQKEKDDGQIP